MVKIKFLKDTEKFKVGEIAEIGETSAENAVSQGFAEYVENEDSRSPEGTGETKAAAPDTSGNSKSYKGNSQIPADISIPKQLQNNQFRFVLLKSNSKIPFEDDWQNTANYSYNDPKVLEHLRKGGNVGLVSGYGSVRCIDDDTGKLAIDLKEVFADTYQEKTWSDKTHFFILSDYNENHVFINKLGEFRAKNYQAVICPSKIDNKKYLVLNDKPIKYFGSEQIKVILRPYIKLDNTYYQSSEKSQTDNSNSGIEFRECIRYCKFALNKGYDNIQLREYVFKQMGVMLKWSKAHPEYRELTFKKALEVALKEHEEKKDSTNKVEVLNLHDALENGIPPIQYVVDKILRQGGLTIVAGEPSARKSLFVQHISLCLIKGTPLFDKFSVIQKKVLWIDFENGFVVLLNRFKSLLYGNYAGNKECTQNLFYSISPALKLDIPETISILRSMIEKTQADVIIIDPFIASIAGDENKSQDVRRAWDGIRTLMEKDGKSFVIIHHIGKDAAKRGLNALRGSSDLGGMAEIVLLLEKNGDFTNVKLEKQRHESNEAFEPFGFLVEKPLGESLRLKYCQNAPAAEDALSQCYNDIIGWLDNNYKAGDEISTKKVLEEMDKFGGHKKWAVNESLKKLTAEKIIKNAGKQGKWTIL